MSRLTSARRTAHDSATNETKGEQLITLEAERQQLQTAVTPPRRLRRYDALGIFATRSTRSATATPGSGSGAPPATWAQAGVPLLVDLRDGTRIPAPTPQPMERAPGQAGPDRVYAPDCSDRPC
jgi:hypothetical protein